MGSKKPDAGGNQSALAWNDPAGLLRAIDIMNDRKVLEGMSLARLPEVMVLGHWSIRTSENLHEPVAFIKMERQASYLVLNPALWKTLCYDLPAQGVLLGDLMSTDRHEAEAEAVDSGRQEEAFWTRVIPTNHEHWMSARRKQAVRTGAPVPDSGVQRLDILVDDARRLVIAASGMSSTIDGHQHRLFRDMYIEISERLTAAEQQVAKIRASMTLAQAALVDAM